jgi:hypothetical protein
VDLGDELPAEDPEYFFTVHSAWCPWKESGMLTVELRRPEITEMKWEKDGQEISEALVDDEVTLCANVKDIEDGEKIPVEIWEHDEDNKHDYVTRLTGTIKNNRLEVSWKVVYTADDDDSTSGKELLEQGYTLPEYHFVISHKRMKDARSPKLKVKGFISGLLIDETTSVTFANMDYILVLPDGSERKGKTRNNGQMVEKGLPIGPRKIKIHRKYIEAILLNGEKHG